MKLAGFGEQKGSDFFKHTYTKGENVKNNIKQTFDPASGNFRDKKTSTPPKVYQKLDLKQGKLLGDNNNGHP